MSTKFSIISRVLTILAALLLITSIFVPIWRIELDAPQYPEGLELLIYADKLAGQVEIINGLNHYIGMKTLHADDFVEFTVLPYIIGSFALLFLVVGIVGKKKLLNFSFWAFVVFGIAAMIDFWFWEYNYGHNLDPNAAIIVPGMAYQPPLIGFKQLLNFGAYSIPAIGGWCLIVGAFFVFVAMNIEAKVIERFRNRKNTTAKMLIVAIIPAGLASCISTESQPIKINSDRCDYCEMTISDGRFGAELITKKGRAYKFDDLQCMLGYEDENKDVEIHSFFVNDYKAKNVLIDATTAFFVKDEELKSPMGGNIAAFNTEDAASDYAKKIETKVLSWGEVNKN